jgi:hypothetical protein
MINLNEQINLLSQNNNKIIKNIDTIDKGSVFYIKLN